MKAVCGVTAVVDDREWSQVRRELVNVLSLWYCP